MTENELRELFASVAGRLMDLKIAFNQRRLTPEMMLAVGAAIKAVDIRLEMLLAEIGHEDERAPASEAAH